MLVHYKVTPSIKFASTHLNTWVERGTVRVVIKCLAKEHNTIQHIYTCTVQSHFAFDLNRGWELILEEVNDNTTVLNMKMHSNELTCVGPWQPKQQQRL